MGAIILTADERPFQVGDYITSHSIKYPPTAPNTTYIVHQSKLTEKQIFEWEHFVSYRLVYVIDKLPKLSKKAKDKLIIHESLLKNVESPQRAIQAMFRYHDRQYVFDLLRKTKTPIPLAVVWMIANDDSDMQKWRLLADSMFTLPDIYCHSIMAYMVKSAPHSPKFPSKSKKHESNDLPMIRDSDIYITDILDTLPEARNEVRDTVPEQTVITKRKESILDWL